MKSLITFFASLVVSTACWAGAVDDCIDSIARGGMKGCSVNAAYGAGKSCKEDPTVCSHNEICFFGTCQDKRQLVNNEAEYGDKLIWASTGSEPDQVILTVLPKELKPRVQFARIECTRIGNTQICHEEKNQE